MKTEEKMHTALCLGDYQLVPLRYEDIFLIKDWRNRQLEVLRQRELLTDEEQERFYFEKVQPSFRIKEPNMILFSYLSEGICVGYGGLVNVNWVDRRAEVSFLMNPDFISDDEIYTIAFSAFLRLIKEYAFSVQNFNRLFTETFDIRSLHIEILENSGFVLEGRLREQTCIGSMFVDSLIHGCLNCKKQA